MIRTALFPALALAFGTWTATPAAAQDFEPVTELGTFVDLLDGRELRLGLFGIALQVTPDGRIEGEARGDTVTGTWVWEDGYFCREMAWGDTPIPYNCQLVEARGERQMRFTTDRGAGESASFNLR